MLSCQADEYGFIIKYKQHPARRVHQLRTTILHKIHKDYYIFVGQQTESKLEKVIFHNELEICYAHNHN